MIYEYKNDDTGEVIEAEFSPSEEEIPQWIEKEGVVYRRVWPFEDNSVAVHIPFQWGESSYRFDKRPRERRKYR